MINIDEEDSSKEQRISDLNKKRWSSTDIETYEQNRDHQFSQANLNRIDNIIKMIHENTEGKKCLDVGVGSGLVLLRELKVFPECIGLDVSIKMALEKDIPESMLVEGDCNHMPFDSEEFDMVSAYAVLHHLPKIVNFFEEAYRVLKKGGYLYTDADKNVYNIKLLRKFKMIQYRITGKKYKANYIAWRDILKHTDIDEYHHMGLDFIELERMLKEIGFEEVILTPRYSINPIHCKRLNFRIMKKLHRWFKLKSFFTHIQLFAIK